MRTAVACSPWKWKVGTESSSHGITFGDSSEIKLRVLQLHGSLSGSLPRFQVIIHLKVYGPFRSPHDSYTTLHEGTLLHIYMIEELAIACSCERRAIYYYAVKILPSGTPFDPELPLDTLSHCKWWYFVYLCARACHLEPCFRTLRMHEPDISPDP